jgi:hypothetical protein
VQVVGIIAVFSIDNVISGTYSAKAELNDLHGLQNLNDFAPCPFGLKVRLATLRNLCCIFVDFITACFAYRPALAKTPSARP